MADVGPFHLKQFGQFYMDTAAVPDTKQGESRSSATVNCHEFTEVNNKFQRIIS